MPGPQAQVSDSAKNSDSSSSSSILPDLMTWLTSSQDNGLTVMGSLPVYTGLSCIPVAVTARGENWIYVVKTRKIEASKWKPNCAT
jgi:hypothetical protein